MKKITNFAIIILFSLLVLTGCAEEENYSMSDKVTEEIRYMENEMIGIVNNFANDTNQEINFDEILKDTRKLEEASNRMMVDLAAENIANDEITKLSDGMNKMISAISAEDQITYLVELNNVFSLFPNYEAQISTDSDEIFERRLKYFTISSYLSFVVGDKELAKTQVTTLESEYLEKQKGIEYVEEHKYNLNKIYLLIEELKKSIEADREELVREKYLLLINEI